MAVVCVRGPLRKLVGGRAEHELEGATVIQPSELCATAAAQMSRRICLLQTAGLTDDLIVGHAPPTHADRAPATHAVLDR